MWVRDNSDRPLMPWDLNRPVEKHQAGGGHDQKSHGAWAGRGGVSGVIEGQSAGDIQQQMLSSGGISVTFTGKGPKGGFMVSHPDTEVVVSDADMRDPVKGKAIIRDFLMKNAKQLQEGRGRRTPAVLMTDQPKNYFGAWFNGKTADNPNGDDKWYLDVSENIDTLTDAVRVGRERKQLAIYSVNADDVINMDSALADYAMSREGGNPQGSSWFSMGSGRRRPDEAMIDAFKAADGGSL